MADFFDNCQPWRQQHKFNTSQTSTLSWSTGTFYVSQASGQAIVTKDRVFYFGGKNSSATNGYVCTAPINSDGTIGTWSLGTDLPAAVQLHQVAYTLDRIFIIGGENSSGSTISSVRTAPVNSDGTIGSWSSLSNLPANDKDFQVAVVKNKMYVFSGSVGYQIYVANIAADGTLSTSFSLTAYLPALRKACAIIQTHSRIYLCGGINSGTTALSSIDEATVAGDGTLGTFAASSSSLPGPLANSQAVVSNGRAYIMGGTNASNTVVDTVYSAPINEDGTLGTWQTDSSLPGVLSKSQAIVTNSKIYLLGGYASNYTNVAYYADFSGGLNDYLDSGYSSDPVMNGAFGAPIPELSGWTGSPGAGIFFDTPLPEIFSDVGEDSVIVGDTDSPIVHLSAKASPTGYSDNTVHHNGKPWQTQYTLNIDQTATIDDWEWDWMVSLPTLVARSQAIVTKNRVYLLGGRNNSGIFNTVYSAPISDAGVIGEWEESGAIPAALNYSQAIITKSRVYLIGGANSAGSAVASVRYAPLNEDGTLGAWSSSADLPGAKTNHQVLVTKSRVYAIGGSLSSSVYAAPIDTDGAIGTWTTETSLPGILSDSAAIATKDRVYLLGGHDGDYPTGIVYTAPFDSSGVIGTWSTGTSLPGHAKNGTAITTRERVYLLRGGDNNAFPTTDVWTAPINEDGTIGTWAAGPDLPQDLMGTTVAVTSSKIYLLGGDNFGYVDYIMSAPFVGGSNDYLFSSFYSDRYIESEIAAPVPELLSIIGAGAIMYGEFVAPKVSIYSESQQIADFSFSVETPEIYGSAITSVVAGFSYHVLASKIEATATTPAVVSADFVVKRPAIHCAIGPTFSFVAPKVGIASTADNPNTARVSFAVSVSSFSSEAIRGPVASCEFYAPFPAVSGSMLNVIPVDVSVVSPRVKISSSSFLHGIASCDFRAPRARKAMRTDVVHDFRVEQFSREPRNIASNPPGMNVCFTSFHAPLTSQSAMTEV